MIDCFIIWDRQVFSYFNGFNGFFMCVLILIKKGSIIQDRHLMNCIKYNDDGAGVGYYTKNGAVVRKIKKTNNQATFDFLQGCLDEAYGNATSDIMVHCRIATGSNCNKENSQPFKVNDKLLVGHNGIFNCVPSFQRISDTRLFCLLLKHHFLTKQEIKEIIGNYNKVIFLTPDKSVIVNEEQGEWVNGVWFSNSSYMDYMDNSNFKVKANDYFLIDGVDYCNYSYDYWNKGLY